MRGPSLVPGMARIMPMCASLLAILVMAGAMPAQGLPIVDDRCAENLGCLAVNDERVVPDLPYLELGIPQLELGIPDQPAAAFGVTDLAQQGNACMDTGDDHGTGGSHTSCRFVCGMGAAIAIGVKASDAQATTYGDAECDTAEASCMEPAPVCAMASPGVAKDTAKGSCNGSTDEFWDSPVLVACIATIPGPDSDPGSVAEDVLEALCEYSNICPGGGGGSLPCTRESGCVVWGLVCQVLGCPLDPGCEKCGSIEDTCTNVLSTVGGLFGNVERLLEDERVSGFVATLIDGTGSLTLVVDPAATCTVSATLAKAP